ncbi:MAG: SPASM domain-containing protein [Heliobacteriaceae bacterium]|jgi:2-deoxy-scyllo-inosamine dehydrogenase (SAM-dependent)|nr:SPASM domain-containing protein [Heliobacteriaceae bacterium]
MNVSHHSNITFGTNLPGAFSKIEVGISKACNLRCSYCPNSLIKGQSKEQLMPIQLFEKILNDLKDIDYDDIIMFHRYNEPLLAPVEAYIRKAKSMLKNIETELFTNGTLLNTERLKSLKAAGIDTIVVTQHTPKGFMDKLTEIPDKLLDGVFVRYNDEVVLMNRAGALTNIPNEISANAPCAVVSRSMSVETDGTVSLCCDDFDSQINWGSVTKKSISEIWTNEKFVKTREMLMQGIRKFPLCQKCSRSSTPVDNWRRLPESNAALFRKKLLQKQGKHT